MSIAQFQPQYLLPSDYATYGLPTIANQVDLPSVVAMASLIIDEYCGCIDGDGNGSLVYTTYTEKILVQTNNRNLIYTGQKPIVAIDATTVAALQALATSGSNYTYTGVQANLLSSYSGVLSGIIAASGRYTYSRQDKNYSYPDQFLMNPYLATTMFGGPAPWLALDITNLEYSNTTGEIWLPASLQIQRYSEVVLMYNAGFNPLAMPNAVKFACASITKNLLAKGDATTAVLRMSVAGGANIALGADVVDPILERMLTPYRRVRAI
jgi:hypothetical protein